MDEKAAGKMFRCKKCGTVDDFGLMLNPGYKGKGEFSKTINEHDELLFNIDGYEFIPDLGFMNAHAVCKVLRRDKMLGIPTSRGFTRE